MRATESSSTYPPCTLERQDFQYLLDGLGARGYQIVGPTVRDDVIVYDVITQVEDLPIGWTEEQDGGTYRLRRRADQALFGYTVGPHTWKRYLLPPLLRLWQAVRTGGHIEFVTESRDTPRYAFLGVRACDLRAIQSQDRVLMQTRFPDPDYSLRRAGAFIVAVNCGQAVATCFCASMGTGPAVGAGFDLALTEVMAPDRHYFVVEIGTQGGLELMAEVPHHQASPDELTAAQRIVAATAAHMGRTLDTDGLPQLLYRHIDQPHWDDIAARCLTCGNCTLVCPTCFCTTVEDATDVSGQRAERWRKLDSCFSVEFSYIYGGSVRASAKARYRQWMMHKLATWVDQFGELGCVGCGRCITWCPVGIDITAVARTLRALDRTGVAVAQPEERQVQHASD